MDDESKPPPLAFANQVIQMLASHLLGDDVKLNLRAYRLIRVVFRRLGGSWFELCQGSPQHTELLIESVKALGAAQK
jgi:hypothetical protein